MPRALLIISSEAGSWAQRRDRELSTLESMLCRLAIGSLARAAVVVVEQPVMPPTPRATAETMTRSLVFMMWIPLRVCVALRAPELGAYRRRHIGIESLPPRQCRRTTPGGDVGASRSDRGLERREEGFARR